MNSTPEINFEVYNGLLMLNAGEDLRMYGSLETVDALIERLREIKPAITYEQSIAMLDG